MIDAIQLPTEDFERKRTELHLEFQESFNFLPKPTAPYVYGIIDIKKINVFNGCATLATKQII